MMRLGERALDLGGGICTFLPITPRQAMEGIVVMVGLPALRPSCLSLVWMSFSAERDIRRGWDFPGYIFKAEQ